jgi:hypothetical protein
LSEARRHSIGDDAPDGVDEAAGGKAEEEVNGSIRVALRARRAPQQHERKHGQKSAEIAWHDGSPFDGAHMGRGNFFVN